MSFHSIWLFREYRSKNEGTTNSIYVWYSLAMVILLGFALAANLLFGQFMWIEHRNFPGGPIAYFNAESTIWFEVLGTVADVLADYLSNALLVNILRFRRNKRQANVLGRFIVATFFGIDGGPLSLFLV